MPITLPALCLVTLVLCNVHGSLEHGIPRRSFLSRRAIDGTRGRKYFDPDEEGAFDSYGSAGGQYDPYEEKTDLSDIRRNVPGEPGVDYPAYTTLPQTGFTCEERSRGYYADEVAGCQVFHVCHDVLVSSFLCPIGSIFSQKLLTCDWWTKVDCSSSSKYIDVNRNSYQQDDDEMIRNAYAMISLQSGMDVTEEGLVDPDRTGSIVDYQRNPSRILDYSPQDTTGNDLKSNFDNYAGPISRDFLPPYQLKDGKETSRSYNGRFFGKSRSPYEDSPIIRVQKINDPNYEGPSRNTDFQQSYQRPNEFTDQFQPSYAPTVPTVTTTTRRFYSPTVPTTFRPSTVAYNKLDQDIDSSDYYFSQSRTKSFVTPPTLRKSDDDYTRQDSYEDYEDVNSEETRDGRSKERFQVRVADNLNFNRTGSSSDRRPFLTSDYRDFNPIKYNEEFVDDFETRGSIGLGHALHDSFRGISVQEQNPVQKKSKDETGSRTEEVKHALIKPEATDRQREDKDETTNRYNDETEEFVHDDIFVPSTTPSVIESTIKASTSPQETSKYPNSEFLPPDIDRKENFRTIDASNPPRSKFQIKVPDLVDVTSSPRYSFQTEGTTELPVFHTTYPDDYIDHSTSLDENLKVTSNYGNVETTTKASYQNDPTTIIRSLISRIASRFPSSPPHPLTVKDPPNDSPTEGSSNRHLPITSFDSENHQSNTERQSSVEDSTLPPVFLHSSKSIPLNETSKENLTQNLNKTSIVSDSSKDNRRLIYRNSDELRQNSGEKDSIEAATVNTSPKSIRSEILKQIEKTVGISNSPYQVTASTDRETVPTEEDFVSKLTVQQDKEISAHNDKIHELKIVKSVDPLVRRTQFETTTVKIVDSRDESHSKNTTELDNFKNRRTVSLLQLMSELLKLDRVPRPFSFSNTQNISPRTTIRNLSLNTELEDETTTDYQETSTEDFRTSVPRSKEEILGQLAENFGDPLYGTGRKSFDLPEKERSISFRTELPYEGTENSEEAKVPTTTVQPTPRSTEITPETTVTTEKTVVKTEFVPSIGFSFDTNEGREEYVEAVLGGLIEPQPAESKREETILKERVEGDAKKNETLAKN